MALGHPVEHEIAAYKAGTAGYQNCHVCGSALKKSFFANGYLNSLEILANHYFFIELSPYLFATEQAHRYPLSIGHGHNALHFFSKFRSVLGLTQVAINTVIDDITAADRIGCHNGPRHGGGFE